MQTDRALMARNNPGVGAQSRHALLLKKRPPRITGWWDQSAGPTVAYIPKGHADMRHFRPLFLLFLLVSMAPAHADMASMWLVVQSPTASGTIGSTLPTNQFQLRIVNVSGAALTPPLTMRTTLPEGISFRQSISADMPCTAAANQRDITCVRSTNLAVGATQLATFIFDVAPDFALIGPDAVVFDASVENTQFPLPLPLVCDTGTDVRTQCARRINDGVASRIEISNITVFNDDILTQGVTESLRFRFIDTGYTQPNGPITLRIHWPPEVSFVSRQAGQLYPFTCSAANSNPTVCTSSADINGTWDFIVNAAVAGNAAVPGPIRIWTEVGNNTPQPIPSAPDCAANMSQIGCFEKAFGVEATPQPVLEITGMSHSPAILPIQTNSGEVTVSFRNSGNAASGNFIVSMQLPPGFSYHSLSAGSGSALTACSATGTAATGQTVRCNRNAGIPVNGSGSGVIRLSLGMGLLSRANPDNTVVAAIATATVDAADPNLLIDCASTPEADHCEHHALPVIGLCGAYVEDIFCNGYE